MSPADRQLVAAWLHGRSSATQDAYRRDAQAFLRHADVGVVGVELHHVQAWADQLSADGLAASTRARKLAAVKSLVRFAREQGYANLNIDAVRAPKTKDTLAARILSEEEVRRMILEEPSSRNRLILRLLYAGALRATELCTLTRADVGDRGAERVQLTIYGKGSKTRHVLVSGRAADELKDLAYKLSSPSARPFPISRQHLWRIVKRAARRAGVNPDASTHWLRHAHATHALWRGADIRLVQSTLGHASIGTTAHYLHVRPEDSSSRYLAL